LSQQFQEDPEPAVLVETEDGDLYRYPAGTTRLPAGSVAWVHAQQWAQGCDEETWKKHLQASRPDLCEVTESTLVNSTSWKIRHVWPALLAVAKVPTAAGDTSTGPDNPEEGENMAKGKKNAASGNKTKSNGAGRGRKSNLDLTKKIVFGEGFKLREGSAVAKRFADLRSGSTVKTALEKGVTAADINWHVKKGNLSLTD